MRQLERARAWWKANRPDAGQAFDDELGHVYSLLAEAPRALQRTDYRRRGDVRACLLPVSGYRLFFVVSDDDAETIVIAVWHARRRPP
ncbi:MAG: hypothetical protein NVS3B10_13500 [Polyangiales bacterium]